jgi:hypothetical protein
MPVRRCRKFTVLTVMITALALVGGLGSCSKKSTGPADDDIKVLFIGNSLTFWNTMPNWFARMCREMDRQVYVYDASIGSTYMAEHVSNPRTVGIITEMDFEWDAVVLQDGSGLEIYPSTRQQLMQIFLVMKLYIRSANPRAGIFMFLDWPDVGSEDESLTADLLIEGTVAMADSLNLMISPVGAAWKRVRAERPNLKMIADDSTHPSKAGSYLQACVYLASIFQRDPRLLTWRPDGVSELIAEYLREVAAETVFNDLERWNIPDWSQPPPF